MVCAERTDPTAKGLVADGAAQLVRFMHIAGLAQK
jgi:hypothetical protein